MRLMHHDYRVRKMKERYAITQMRKQANRMTFGEVSSVSKAVLNCARHA